MRGARTKRRLLIFVIAYKAETTLKSALERIPRSIFDDYSGCRLYSVRALEAIPFKLSSNDFDFDTDTFCCS